MPAKIIHAPNLARSAIAPEISATVMIAKVAWKATNASGGYAGALGGVEQCCTSSRSRCRSNSPREADACPSTVGNAIA